MDQSAALRCRVGHALRRDSCEEAARLLGLASLREVAFDDLDKTLDRLPDITIRARARPAGPVRGDHQGHLGSRVRGLFGISGSFGRAVSTNCGARSTT